MDGRHAVPHRNAAEDAADADCKPPAGHHGMDGFDRR